MPFQGRRERIHPLGSRDEVLQRPCGRNVFDPERNDVNAPINGALYLAFDLRRGVRTLRKDQDHDATRFNRINDRFAPIGARHHITRRYPAGHRVCFEPRQDRLGNSFVLYRVTYENVVSHLRQFSSPIARLLSLIIGTIGCRFKFNRLHSSSTTGNRENVRDNSMGRTSVRANLNGRNTPLSNHSTRRETKFHPTGSTREFRHSRCLTLLGKHGLNAKCFKNFPAPPVRFDFNYYL